MLTGNEGNPDALGPPPSTSSSGVIRGNQNTTNQHSHIHSGGTSTTSRLSVPSSLHSNIPTSLHSFQNSRNNYYSSSPSQKGSSYPLDTLVNSGSTHGSRHSSATSSNGNPTPFLDCSGAHGGHSSSASFQFSFSQQFNYFAGLPFWGALHAGTAAGTKATSSSSATAESEDPSRNGSSWHGGDASSKSKVKNQNIMSPPQVTAPAGLTFMMLDNAHRKYRGGSGGGGYGHNTPIGLAAASSSSATTEDDVIITDDDDDIASPHSSSTLLPSTGAVNLSTAAAAESTSAKISRILNNRHYHQQHHGISITCLNSPQNASKKKIKSFTIDELLKPDKNCSSSNNDSNNNSGGNSNNFGGSKLSENVAISYKSVSQSDDNLVKNKKSKCSSGD